jgi:hypothetical protein
MLKAVTDKNRADGIEKIIRTIRCKFLIGGYFNGHHHSWGKFYYGQQPVPLYHRIGNNHYVAK